MPIYDSKMAKATQFFAASYFGDVVIAIDAVLLNGDQFSKKSKKGDPFTIQYA
jgi:hypothetical protein